MQQRVKKMHCIDLNIEVTGNERATKVQDIFHAEFSPLPPSGHQLWIRVTLLKSYARDGNVWTLYVYYESVRKPSASVVTLYKHFIRGVLATLYYIDPLERQGNE